MKQIDLSQWLVACYQSFARRIGLTGLVGLLLCCCAFGEGRAPSPTYYDARERAAAALTFESHCLTLRLQLSISVPSHEGLHKRRACFSGLYRLVAGSPTRHSFWSRGKPSASRFSRYLRQQARARVRMR